MQRRTAAARLTALATACALVIGFVQVTALPEALPRAQAAEGVTLSSPSLLHGNGASLTWSRYSSSTGVAFTAYEVHRSASPAFTPSAATLLTTIRDINTTTFTDDSAAGSTAYSYRVVASSASNEVRVTLPAVGTSRLTLQPDPAAGRATYLTRKNIATSCGDDYTMGAYDRLGVGNDTAGYMNRALLRFDLSMIPSKARVTSANLNMWYVANTATDTGVRLHRMLQPWSEGTGKSTCGPATAGATWAEAQPGVPWRQSGKNTLGGVYDATAAVALPVKTRSTVGYDAFVLTSLVQQWANGTPNHGLLVKQASETSYAAPGNRISYYSDDEVTDPTKRPALTVAWDDATKVARPSVKLTSPAAGTTVRGTVPVTAVASAPRGVRDVAFSVDGVQKAVDSSAPFTFTWSTTGLSGNHTLSATTTSKAGASATSSYAVTVDNSPPPTGVAVTGPANGATGKGIVNLTASATDDTSVARVDFMVDGTKVGTDTTAPYELAWNTLDPEATVSDGPRQITAVATDSSGGSTTSPATSLTVANAAGTMYSARFDLNEVGSSNTTPFVLPPVLEDHLSAPSVDTSISTRKLSSAPNCNTDCGGTSLAQDSTGAMMLPEAPPSDDPVTPGGFKLDVTVTNTSTLEWKGSDLQLWYRWYTEDGVVLFEGPGTDYFPTVVKPQQSKIVPVTVEEPPLPVGVDRSRLRLRFDIYDNGSAAPVKWFAAKGNKPADNPVIVNRELSENLGLERFWHYDQMALGAGATAYTNVANGNVLWRWSPWATPGRGVASVVDLTYNSLEEHSDSPAGNNVSLNISGLSRFGSVLDIHPNQADKSTGKSNKWVTFVDGDGTTHKFTGTTNADGTTTWTEPAGVNLYLRSTGSTDPKRYWALSRPDRLTYFFDEDGYPRSVEDTNGNVLEFELVDTPPGEDPGGPKKRVVKIWDPARRAYSVDYWDKGEVKGGRVRGKVQRITDHSGSTLDFHYYDDGNLLKVVQKGGVSAEGIAVVDRSFVFSYWNSNGSEPAIPLASDRVNPDPSTHNQTTKVFSIRDPLGSESTIAYWGPQPDPKNRWKVRTWTDRAGKTSTFTHNWQSRIATVDKPLSRDSEFTYDTEGRVTRIADPLERATSLVWSADNKVTQVTHPNQRTDTFSYNHNGYLTSQTNEAGETSQLTYENRKLDARDTLGHWSVLRSRVKPEGVASATAGDHTWLFTPDADGNITTIEDPDGFKSTYTYNLRGSTDAGTVRTQAKPKGGTTTYEYHVSGQPSKMTDPVGNVRTFFYNADSQTVGMQDGEHQDDSGTDVRSYRQVFDFDEFNRLARQSQPKSTDFDRGNLVWTANTYDANDNIKTTTVPTYAGADGPPVTAPVTSLAYDVMDRPTLQTGPDTSVDPAGERTAWTYDDAGRTLTQTAPKGVRSVTAGDFQTLSSYDLLDRVTRVAAYGVSATDVRYTHQCYDISGDVVSSTAPRAKLATIDCAAPSIPFTTRVTYDAAHRPLTQADPGGHQQRTAYNKNGEVIRTEKDIDTSVTPARMQKTDVGYNERGLMTSSVETFSAATGRKLTSLYQYDANGNKTAEISPRAHDADAGAGTYTNYTKRLDYDSADQMVRSTLPFDGRDGTERQYVHVAYDKNGRQAWSSQPTTQADAVAVSTSAKTAQAYYDPGWVRRLGKTVNPSLFFDYDAMGMQTYRVPDKAGQPGVPDLEQEMSWSYFTDGQKRTMTDRDGNSATWSYDEHNQVVTSFDPTGVHGTNDKAVEVGATYSGFGEVAKARYRKDQDATWKFATFTYNEHGQAVQRLENGEEDAAGTQTKAPKTIKLTYDAADWMTEQLDLGTDSACKDDTRTTTTYWGTGWERQRDQWRGADGCTSDPVTWKKRQGTSWTHFDNGKLDTLRTVNGGGQVTESHDVGYFEGTRYEDGHRVTDNFILKRAADKAGATSCVGASPCVADWDYDARGKVLKHQMQAGKVTTYRLDEPGNLIGDTTIRSGNVTTETAEGVSTTRKYESNQLRESSTGGAAPAKTWYDPFGNTDCVTTSVGTQAQCNGPKNRAAATVLQEYAYDPMDRMLAQASYSGGGGAPKDSSEYVYDALDRTLEESEDHEGTANDRVTTFAHLGLSSLVTEEKQSGGSDPRTKTYAYNAMGQRTSMTDQATGAADSTKQSYGYGYDVHASVSQLLDDTGGVKASYGYDAYGKPDSRDDDPQGLTSGDTNDLKPLNPFRFSGKRLDSGTAGTGKEASSMDMGARRYGLDTGRFLQQDMFHSSLGDLGLSLDPLSQNRYALAGGNPVSNMEVDGHVLSADGGGGGTTTGGTSTTSSGTDSSSASSGGDSGGGEDDSGGLGGWLQDRGEDLKKLEGTIDEDQLKQDALGAISGARSYMQKDRQWMRSNAPESLQPTFEMGYDLMESTLDDSEGCIKGSSTDCGLLAVGFVPGGKLARPAAKAAKGTDATKSETELVQRWMSRAELSATRETGLVRGGREGTHYVTDFANHSAQRARQRLALPQTPDIRVQLEVPQGVFSPPKRVAQAFGMPGGGMERTATGPIACRVVCVWE